MLLKNYIMWIFWQMWSWKTLLATIIASNYDRIYCNYEIKWIKIQKIKNMNDILNIEYNDEKWILILDEFNINASSRNSMTKKNKQLNELLVLSRKKNLDICVIWQDFYWIDKVYRNLIQYVFMPKIYDDWKLLIEIYKLKKWEHIKIKTILMKENPFKFLFKNNIEYDTTETNLIF